jgi:hypothetical protein
MSLTNIFNWNFLNFIPRQKILALAAHLGLKAVEN